VPMNVTRICPSLAMRGASGSSMFASFVRNPSRARSARHSASTRAGGHADGERDPQWHEHDLVEYPRAGDRKGDVRRLAPDRDLGITREQLSMVARRAKAAVTTRRPTGRTPSRPRKAVRWSILRVILGSKGGQELVDPPGRDLLMSSAHTFGELASAIDRAFARWDLSHVHEFRLVDGRRIVMEDADEFQETASANDLDERAHSLSSMGLNPGDTFTYVFDLGDDWEHGCTVLRTDVDPEEVAGIVPSEILPIFGWGTIPDQYGRLSPNDDQDE